MFSFNPVNKPSHKRSKPKRAQRTAFSEETRRSIYERDQGLCVRCHRVAADIHHIEYRSSLTEDVQHKRNGACLCLSCHEWVHSSKEARKWMRAWKENNLDENGDYNLPFSDLD